LTESKASGAKVQNVMPLYNKGASVLANAFMNRSDFSAAPL
jgi:hypothetical protein